MNRIFLLLVILVTLSCSTLPNEKSKTVRIIDSNEAQGCTFITTLGAFDTVSPTFKKERESVVVKLKEDAANINANAIVLTDLQTTFAGSSGLAKVYNCPPPPSSISLEKLILTNEELSLLQSRALSGDSQSQYLYGVSVLDTDVTKGLYWLRLSAKQDYALSQGYLGLLYYKGDIVEKNHFKAVEWRLKASKNGDSLSQGALGFAYILGEGVPENLGQAYVWMSMSSTQGNKEIKPWLGKLKSKMSKEQLTIAQNLSAKCWKSKFKNCE